MIQFIFTLVLMFSLGVILFLLARSLPRVEEDFNQPQKNFWDKLIASEIPEKIDGAFYVVLAKTLRRFKVVLLRVDNSLTDKLKKISPAENGAKLKIDFNKINPANGAGGNQKGEEKPLEGTPESV